MYIFMMYIKICNRSATEHLNASTTMSKDAIILQSLDLTKEYFQEFVLFSTLQPHP